MVEQPSSADAYGALEQRFREPAWALLKRIYHSFSHIPLGLLIVIMITPTPTPRSVDLNHGTIVVTTNGSNYWIEEEIPLTYIWSFSAHLTHSPIHLYLCQAHRGLDLGHPSAPEWDPGCS